MTQIPLPADDYPTCDTCRHWGKLKQSDDDLSCTHPGSDHFGHLLSGEHPECGWYKKRE